MDGVVPDTAVISISMTTTGFSILPRFGREPELPDAVMACA